MTRRASRAEIQRASDAALCAIDTLRQLYAAVVSKAGDKHPAGFDVDRVEKLLARVEGEGAILSEALGVVGVIEALATANNNCGVVLGNWDRNCWAEWVFAVVDRVWCAAARIVDDNGERVPCKDAIVHGWPLLRECFGPDTIDFDNVRADVVAELRRTGGEPGKTAPAAEHNAAVRTPLKRRGNVNARMLELIQNNPDAMGWNTTQWQKHLHCAKSSVVETQTWKDLSTRRDRERAERAMDRRRKQKPSDRTRD